MKLDTSTHLSRELTKKMVTLVNLYFKLQYIEVSNISSLKLYSSFQVIRSHNYDPLNDNYPVVVCEMILMLKVQLCF